MAEFLCAGESALDFHRNTNTQKRGQILIRPSNSRRNLARQTRGPGARSIIYIAPRAKGAGDILTERLHSRRHRNEVIDDRILCLATNDSQTIRNRIIQMKRHLVIRKRIYRGDGNRVNLE